ncbi:hypothetical protein GGQ97_002304 [Sphingomonas kaistensis]|uniref:Uncharacterized protein n=1 Tax=Sphingomonas kaistensis TaxID=298708 RepID=A0A7X5Y7N5_9SPHN|nr:hypothetical protein [Sphingomonas kaistensis]NJC06511.1 hypothetical protein [Sphingomonas kaistensis]
MIDLPLSPAPRGVTPTPVDFGALLEGPLGGETQRVERQGSRWAVQVDMPPMKHPTDGRVFVSRLVRGISEGVRMAFPLLGFDPGAPGSAVVSGSGQSGRTLNIKSATAGYVFKEGQFFSLVRAGRHHLYQVGTDATVSGGGTATLSIWPMLRAQHLDGDVLHVVQPMIEGYVAADQLAWEMALGDFTSLSFTIREAA